MSEPDRDTSLSRTAASVVVAGIAWRYLVGVLAGLPLALNSAAFPEIAGDPLLTGQPAGSGRRAGSDLARQAWYWALANRDEHGALPIGRAIARAYGRKERWGRLVKRAGLAGAFDAEGARELRPVSGERMSGAGSAL